MNRQKHQDHRAEWRDWVDLELLWKAWGRAKTAASAISSLSDQLLNLLSSRRLVRSDQSKYRVLLALRVLAIAKGERTTAGCVESEVVGTEGCSAHHRRNRRKHADHRPSSNRGRATTL